jgi:hypothetical protein
MINLRASVWEYLLDAEMNVRYWGYLVQRFMRREKVLKITLAFTSSSTILSLHWWQRFPDVPVGLGALNAAVAIILPILNYSERIETIANLRGSWRQLCIEYERLWQRAYTGDSLSECENELRLLKDRTVQLGNIESRQPDDRKLVRRCQQEVKQARGLTG